MRAIRYMYKQLSFFIYRQEKTTTAAFRSLRAKIVIVGNSKWVKTHISVLSYLTVLVYTRLVVLVA